MLEMIRLSLRLTNEEFDSEIESLIEACKTDLQVAGVVNIADDDPLILRAATLYCKGHFGFANIGADFLESYEMLKKVLCISSKYNTLAGGSNV